jgi:hypothetical protein
MTDLLGKGLGSKSSTEGASNTDASQTNTGNIPKVDLKGNDRGANLISSVGNKTVAAATEQLSVETESRSVVEPPKSATVNDPDSWSKEDALKEVKKLREENKSVRTKYSESVETLKSEMELRVAAVKAEQEVLLKAKEELDSLRAKEEDKKRDLAEKVAHRDALNAELKARLEATERTKNQEVESLKTRVERYEAESRAQSQVYETRLAQELAGIPEKYREMATAMTKGAGDPRDALVMISEAKLNGLFENKTVVVNHSVPGASQGARSSQDKLDAAVAADKAKMNSSQKIGTALKDIRAGAKNDAFRIR